MPERNPLFSLFLVLILVATFPAVSATPQTNILLPENTTYEPGNIPLNVSSNESIINWTFNLNGVNSILNLPIVIVNDTGIRNEGNLTSLLFNDSDAWNLTEVIGSPGWIIAINYTGLYNPTSYRINSFYDGSAGHAVNVELLNCSNGVWVQIGNITDGSAYSWVNSSINEGFNFVCDGNMSTRIHHSSPGNINHNYSIEMIEIQDNYTFTPNISLWNLQIGNYNLTVSTNSTAGDLNSSEVFFTVAENATTTTSILQLGNITAIIQELPALFGAIADTIPAIVRIILNLAVALFIVGIFGVLVTSIANLFRTQKME